MTPPAPLRLTVDLNSWVGVFQRELDALLSDMIQLCSAAEQNRYTDTVMNQRGGVQMMIQNAEALGENAPQRAARNAFMGAMSKFGGFLDRLIASRNIARDGMSVTRELRGEAEVIAYVNEMLEEAVSAVARDNGMTLPRKIECFSGVDTAIKEMALNYNKLRNALEHHHDLPRAEIKVKIRRMIVSVRPTQVRSAP
jgi:hypothetical protein